MKGVFNLKKSSDKKAPKIFLFVIILLVMAFFALIGFVTDYLWFKEIGYVSVFFTKLFTQLKVGIPLFIILSLSSYIYFKLLKRDYYIHVIGSEMTKSKKVNIISWALALIFGGIISFLVVTRMWFSVLQFSNSTDFGVKDPIFGFDISFYVFKLDFLKDLNIIVIIFLVLILLLTFFYYSLLVIVKPPSTENGEDVNPFESEDRFNTSFHNKEEDEETNIFGNSPSGVILNKLFQILKGTKVGRKNINSIKKGKALKTDKHGYLFTIASRQITIAGCLLFIMLFVHFVLSQFNLLYAHRGAVYGAGYTDTTVTLWVCRILAVLSLLGAIMVFRGVKKRKFIGIIVVTMTMGVVILVGFVGAGLVQSLVVSPNEMSIESKYLKRNISYTQKAYGLDKVDVRKFSAESNLTPKDIRDNDATINNVRINDYEPTEIFYNQTQSIRQYYQFRDVDLDRYHVNGDYTQVFISAREIDEKRISQTWLNKHIKYTHGYGLALSRVDEVTRSGQPKLLIDNIPPRSSVSEIEIVRPEVYFGEMTNDYIIVGAKDDEFDYPDGDANKYTRYEGSGGIKLSLLNRLMFSIREGSLKLLVSSNINSNSKIIINRNVADRVRKIMPYLNYDSDPYLVAAKGKLYWMLDAYTVSDKYPYSEPYDKQTSLNYIRNSVKVVVDAYNGDVDFYIVDKQDPIASTFKNIYPKLFKDVEQMPKEIKSHIRYPNILFDIQAKVYKRYHMNDVKVFYQDEDLWDIAKEIYGTSEREMIPNYYIMKIPGEKKAEFVNTIPFTPRDKKNMTGLFVARNDGDDYGKLVLFKLPKSKLVYGPRQIEAQIDQDTEISKDFSLWNSSGSKYSRGNMFVIPINQSLLYVEPVYLEASDSSIPEVKRVIVVYGDQISYKKTLAEALDNLFGTGVYGNKERSNGKEVDRTMADVIRDANSTYDRAIEAQKKGDWSEYGKQMKKLEKFLKEMK